MLVLILIGVLTLLVLVGAFLGSKVWHWAHVLVVVALFFATVGFAFLAADVTRTRQKYLNQEQQALSRLEPLLELERALARGTGDASLVNQLSARDVEIAIDDNTKRAPGLVDVEHRLRLENRRLGRVWRDAQPLGPPDPETGQVAIGIEFPQPLGIAEGDIVFGFEQGPANAQDPTQGRQYLAEFRVTSVAGQQLTLEPVLALDADETQRLAQSSGPWSLYETMPVDRHALFAGFSEEQLRSVMPAGSVADYLRDGTPWTVDDGEWVREGRNESDELVGPDDWDDSTTFVYRRALRDYDFLFNDLAKARIEMISRAQALQEDTDRLNAAIASAKQLEEYRLGERAKLESDRESVLADRQAVEAHLASLERQLRLGRRLLDRVIASNDKLADQLAAWQSALAGGIDLNEQPVPSRGALDIDAL